MAERKERKKTNKQYTHIDSMIFLNFLLLLFPSWHSMRNSATEFESLSIPVQYYTSSAMWVLLGLILYNAVQKE